MMDNDLAELNLEVDANTRTLEALATTQAQHGSVLGRLDGRAARVECRLDALKADVGELQAGIRQMKVAVRVIDVKLDELLGI
jgi:hypothetical protein